MAKHKRAPNLTEEENRALYEAVKELQDKGIGVKKAIARLINERSLSPELIAKVGAFDEKSYLPKYSVLKAMAKKKGWGRSSLKALATPRKSYGVYSYTEHLEGLRKRLKEISDAIDDVANSL